MLVLAYLMVSEGPKVVDGTLNLFVPATGTRVRRHPFRAGRHRSPGVLHPVPLLENHLLQPLGFIRTTG